MIYSFFEPFGTAGWFAAALLVIAPYFFITQVGDSVGSVRRTTRWAWFFTLLGAIAMPLITIGYHMDGKLIAHNSGWFSGYYLGDLPPQELQDWKDNHPIANAGIIKPSDAFFLPWLTGLVGAGLSLTYGMFLLRLSTAGDRRARKDQRRREKRDAKQAKQQQTMAEKQRLREEKSSREEAARNRPEYDDLESALAFFTNKSKRIQTLDIDEDEKEMLLMRLQEKKEKVMEQFV